MDRAAIDSLYRRYGPAVLRRARTLLRDEEAARDAMQEVFIRAIRAGESFRAEASPMTWLYRITTNYCLNLRRDSARRAELLKIKLHLPEDNQISAEDRRSVVELLGQVSEETGAIAVYYYVDEMRQEDIADTLSVSRRYVRTRLEEFRNHALRALGETGEVA